MLPVRLHVPRSQTGRFALKGTVTLACHVLRQPIRLVPVPAMALGALFRTGDCSSRLFPSTLSSEAGCRLLGSRTVDITRIIQATGYRTRFTTD